MKFEDIGIVIIIVVPSVFVLSVLKAGVSTDCPNKQDLTSEAIEEGWTQEELSKLNELLDKVRER